MKKRLTIPIYDVTLWVIVTEDIPKARVAMGRQLGVCVEDDVGDPGGLCAFTGSRIGLFFTKGQVQVDDVAHEVLHATMRILEITGVHFDAEKHESATYLNGYLMKRVMAALKEELG